MIHLNRILAKAAGLMLVVIACFMGSPSQVGAISLTIGDSRTLGLTPGEPSSPTDEASYITFLVGLVPGTTIAGPSSPPNYSRTTNVLCFPTCPAATSVGSVTGAQGVASGQFGAGYTYLLGKYDGPNGGDVIWYVAGLTGVFDIPTELAPNPLCTTGSCGLSHLALFNPGGGTPGGGTPGGGTPVPEPSSLLLVGSGLLALRGLARRFRKSAD